MGLRSVFANAAETIFTALGDVPVSTVYRRTVMTYNPDTGDNTVVQTDTTSQAIFLRFNEIEVARTVGLQATDVKMIVKIASMTVVPDIQIDTIVTAAKTYNIVSYNQDPAGAIYILQLRAP